MSRDAGIHRARQQLGDRVELVTLRCAGGAESVTVIAQRCDQRLPILVQVARVYGAPRPRLVTWLLVRRKAPRGRGHVPPGPAREVGSYAVATYSRGRGDVGQRSRSGRLRRAAARARGRAMLGPRGAAGRSDRRVGLRGRGNDGGQGERRVVLARMRAQVPASGAAAFALVGPAGLVLELVKACLADAVDALTRHLAERPVSAWSSALAADAAAAGAWIATVLDCRRSRATALMSVPTRRMPGSRRLAVSAASRGRVLIRASTECRSGDLE